jgi:hypothetical protein
MHRNRLYSYDRRSRHTENVDQFEIAMSRQNTGNQCNFLTFMNNHSEWKIAKYSLSGK